MVAVPGIGAMRVLFGHVGHVLPLHAYTELHWPSSAYYVAYPAHSHVQYHECVRQLPGSWPPGESHSPVTRPVLVQVFFILCTRGWYVILARKQKSVTLSSLHC